MKSFIITQNHQLRRIRQLWTTSLLTTTQSTQIPSHPYVVVVIWCHLTEYSSGARTAVFNRWSDGHCPTKARANWSDRFVRPVPAGPVRPFPGTDRTGLSDPAAGASVGQCLSDHRSNTAV
ncbi:hypothetical protein PCASD_10160 [Puccinia coronata f. sp. avenae]|uniref:Uncharacterized protein n=1 Tax=Puccinia coronata f. sp. avenae TaxID=200324 RepID=A0A2N5UGM0_9BASI|nr:hypothetical protein PCASD_10160 [Puccinia coronata f. sp. avenae]